MSKEKNIVEHEIKTIADIFDVVNDDNINDFFQDLYLFVAQIGKIKQKHPEVEIKSMIWKDDGINQITGVMVNGQFIDFRQKKENNDIS